MTKKQRIIHTRGSLVETPNWKFALKTSIPRAERTRFCEALAYIALERNGGYYYYPHYNENRLGAAFEWYLPFDRLRFGFKVGIEFWVEGDNLEKISGYVLYGEDHPKRGSVISFSQKEQIEFQNKIIDTLKLASEIHTLVPAETFYPVYYLKYPSMDAIDVILELPAFNAHVMPTVHIGKYKTPVSAVVLSVDAHFKEEAKRQGAEAFARLCALLTLATGRYYCPWKARLRGRMNKQFLKSLVPKPALDELYPKGKYSIPVPNLQRSVAKPMCLISEYYSCIPQPERSRLFDSVFAFYTAKDLASRKFPTVAAVALIAALSLFRRQDECAGTLNCSNCGDLAFRHKERGEAKSIAIELCKLFDLDGRDDICAKLSETIKKVYSRQRSSYVHDAILRHGEYRNSSIQRGAPTQASAFSEPLIAENQLNTLEMVTRRALLQKTAQLAGQPFDPDSFEIVVDKLELQSSLIAGFHVPQKVLVAIRA